MTATEVVPGFYRQGRCEKCGIPMFGEANEVRSICSFCSGTPERGPKARHKTEGEMIIEAVAARHKDCCGKTVIKMTAEARADLVQEINARIK